MNWVLPIGLAMALVACTPATTSNVSPGVDITSTLQAQGIQWHLTGQVSRYQEDDRFGQIWTYLPQPTRTGAGFRLQHVGATARLAPDGSFDVTLPDAASMEPFLMSSESLREGCTGTLTLSDPTARRAAPLLMAPEAGSNAPHFLVLQTYDLRSSPRTGDREVRFWYLDRDTRLTGRLNCPGSPLPSIQTYDLQLKRGWNVVTSTLTVTPDVHSSAFTTELIVDPHLWWLMQ